MTSCVRCSICNRQLKDAEAIRLGMGSKCAKKNGYSKRYVKTWRGTSKQARRREELRLETLGISLFQDGEIA